MGHKSGYGLHSRFLLQGGLADRPKNWLFYIYSQVQLANRGCPKAGYSFSHGIYLRSSTYPEVELGLLKGRNTPCEVLDGRQELWFDTSSLGGLVFLQAKDEVLVRLLDISIIRVREEMQSYFGAFMV